MRSPIESADDIDSWDGLDPLDLLYGWRGEPAPPPSKTLSGEHTSDTTKPHGPRLRTLPVVVLLALWVPVAVLLLRKLAA